MMQKIKKTKRNALTFKQRVTVKRAQICERGNGGEKDGRRDYLADMQNCF